MHDDVTCVVLTVLDSSFVIKLVVFHLFRSVQYRRQTRKIQKTLESYREKNCVQDGVRSRDITHVFVYTVVQCRTAVASYARQFMRNTVVSPARKSQKYEYVHKVIFSVDGCNIYGHYKRGNGIHECIHYFF